MKAGVLNYPQNLIYQIGGFEVDVDLNTLEDNFDAILTDYFDSEKCYFDEREKSVIIKRFKENKTLDQVGLEIGVTRARIRQIESNAIRKFRHPSIRRLFNQDFSEYLQLLQRREIAKKQINEECEKLEDFLEKARFYLEDKEHTTLADVERFLSKEGFETRKSALLNSDISELQLSVRANNCLLRARIKTIKQLTEKTEEELNNVRNLGAKCIREIKEQLDQLGLSLKK